MGGFINMWLFLVEIGFAGFLLCLFALVWRGFDRNGAARRAAPLWLLAAAVFYLVWFVALPRVPRPDIAVATEVAARK